MAWSSALVSVAWSISPRANFARCSSSAFGRSRLPMCSARNGGLIWDNIVVLRADALGLQPVERLVDVPGMPLGVLRVVAPGRVEIGQRLQRNHLGLGLALVEQLLDAIVRGHQHGAEGDEVGLGGET